jgi:hypothetical protein
VEFPSVNDDVRILVSQLAGSSAWDALEEYLNERRVALLARIVSGHLSLDEYHRACGEIQGLDVVLTAPQNPDPRRPASRSFTPTTSRH